MVTTPVLVLPGYVTPSGHWQSRWEAADGNLRRVLQRDWLMPDRASGWRGSRREIAACAAPRCSSPQSRLRARRASGEGRRGGIKAALLVAPADVEVVAITWRRCRASRRCRSSAAFRASSSPQRRSVRDAGARGSLRAPRGAGRLVTLTRAGHVNTDSGFGPWDEGRRLLEELR